MICFGKKRRVEALFFMHCGGRLYGVQSVDIWGLAWECGERDSG